MKKNYNIFKTLEYPLTVKAAKIVVPVYLWNLSTAGKIFVQLNALQHAGIAPIASVKGYRQFLKQNKNNEKVLNSWYYEPLIDRTKIKKDIPLTNPIPSMMQMFISVLAKEFMSSDAIFLVVNGFKGQLIKNGYSKEGAEDIGTRCMELFNNQKSRYMKDFIG